ncbi:MAG: alpha-galactosidase [Chthonomonadales bacterium]|nr:alpha-galactosidase [Chthonomonadales bacterium]
MDPHPLRCRPSDGGLVVDAPGWPGFALGPLVPALDLGGGPLPMVGCEAPPAPSDGALSVTTTFAGGIAALLQRVEPLSAGGLRLSATLSFRGSAPAPLRAVRLLASRAGAPCRFGADAAAVRIYEQGSTWARVRPLAASPKPGRTDGEDAPESRPAAGSLLVWSAFDGAARQALLVGFESSERWLGTITSAPDGAWHAGFDGGDVLLDPGEDVALEDLLLLRGPDPWALLERYGDLTAARFPASLPKEPPVTWCSWYPYRLGVTEEAVLANARAARARLASLGLRWMLVDLGWQRDGLPDSLEESAAFPGGLARLGERLDALGLRLGAWTAPFIVGERSLVCAQHPEWLLRGPDGSLASLGEWYWEPHERTYALDLTHPGARAHLRAAVDTLARRGVRYLKPDFLGGVQSAALRVRHDARTVAGGGAEAARAGAAILLEAMRAADPEALVLNCGAPEAPGTGALPLLYSCADTGNTGYVGWRHLREDYGGALAGHLWKHRRWGILQPSCLVVGLPGTLEEARVRATATFLCGGQVDVGDDLTTLPEDRWQVLTAVLPPLGRAARPVDLFEPVEAVSLNYDGLARGTAPDEVEEEDEGEPVSRVWALPVEADWDHWVLAGLFSYTPNDAAAYGQARITRFRLPLERLGLDPGANWTAHELWSAQCLGELPEPANSPGYAHPGDARTLIASPAHGVLEVAFFGPAVKVLALRRARSHPWPTGTSFHLSGGAELGGVAWDGSTLRGVLRRPAGEQGVLVVSCAGRGLPLGAEAAGRSVPLRAGASGSAVVPIVAEGPETPWELCWEGGD